MKLLFCTACGDVVKLRTEAVRMCFCGLSWGRYDPDGISGEIGGKAIPLGFANPSFANALRNQPDSGAGREFAAFVIPKVCLTVRKAR